MHALFFGIFLRQDVSNFWNVEEIKESSPTYLFNVRVEGHILIRNESSIPNLSDRVYSCLWTARELWKIGLMMSGSGPPRYLWCWLCVCKVATFRAPNIIFHSNTTVSTEPIYSVWPPPREHQLAKQLAKAFHAAGNKITSTNSFDPLLMTWQSMHRVIQRLSLWSKSWHSVSQLRTTQDLSQTS